MYNGNISETYWKTNNDAIQRMYGYDYDGLNRLTKATSLKVDEDLYDAYNESLYYDKNGNILSLQRNGGLESLTQTNLIDNLSYFYDSDNKNKLLKVTDLSNSQEGFKDDAIGTLESDTEDDYVYDHYGNMTKDENKKIENITYNHLNLPVKINFNDGHYISYVYDATGIKLKKTVFNATTNTTSTTDYLGGFQYMDNALSFLFTAEGYVKPAETGGGYQYVYNYTDHLGNTRLSYTFDTATSSLQILEENNYYPFGLKHKGYNEQNLNLEYQYQYNGKEWQDELGYNMYDMDMRQYDPAIARWVVQDPVVHYSMSPYNAFDDNPVFWADPSGGETWQYDWEKNNGTYKNSKGETTKDWQKAINETVNGGDGNDDIIIRGKNIMTNKMEKAVIIKTDLIDVTVDIEEMPLIPEIESLTLRVKPIEPIIIEGTDQALNSPLLSAFGEADAIQVSLNASFTLIAGATGGYTISAFLSGNDSGKAFLYSNSIDDGNEPIPSVGVLAGGGIEVGGVYSNVKDFDRRTLMGYSLNLSGGYGAYSGTITKGLQSKWAWLKPATYYSVSLGLGGGSIKYGAAGTLNYSRLKRQL